MGIGELLVVSLVPVGEVLLITAIGLSLATDRVNLLGPNARHILNNLVFYVFSPALVVSQLAENITFSSLLTLWFMPVNILVTFVIGTGLAWVVIRLTRTPPEVQGLVIGCCSAGNLGNLLLIIVPAVCEESNSPFGDPTVCSTLGEAYASLSMAVGAVYIWTYVYFMMGIYRVANNNNETQETRAEIGIDCTQPFLPSSSNGYSLNSTKEGLWGKASNVIRNVTSKIDLKKVFAPSTIATIIGFTIGSVSPIRKLIIGTSAPLRVLYNSASLLGDALIPSMTLIVGANLLQGLKREGVSKGVIMGIIGVRYVAMPVIGIGVVKAAECLGMVGSDDKMYQFVLMLQFGLPPAMNISIMAQLFHSGESQCSVIMLWSYAVAAFSLTLWSTFYLWFLH